MSRRLLAEGSATGVGMAEARESVGMGGNVRFVSVFNAQLSFLWRRIISSCQTSLLLQIGLLS